ncbi:MAG: PTS sugar transporter subunit IIA [Alkalispirochaeta sp.]|jgi:fructose-specific phosphotransferase system IIA component
MEAISDVLDASCVSLDIQSKKKPDIIAELVQLLADAGKIDNPDTITELVIQRESLMSTGIGGGIAVPHCLSRDINHTLIAFGRHLKGVKFDAVDKKPVQLFFLMVGPEGAQSDHLRLLSRLSRLLHDETLKTGLLEATTAEEVVELFYRRENEGR